MIKKIDINEVERTMPDGIPAKLRAIDNNDNSIIANLQGVFKGGVDKLLMSLPVIFNTPVLLGEGVGILILQEPWLAIDTSLFFISTTEIFRIRDTYESFRKLSLSNGKIYWTETSNQSEKIRIWFMNIRGFSYS